MSCIKTQFLSNFGPTSNNATSWQLPLTKVDEPDNRVYPEKKVTKGGAKDQEGKELTKRHVVICKLAQR